MSTRLFLLIAAVISTGASDAFAQATSVTLHFFPLTGEVRFVNDSSMDFTFVLYELSSPSGALNGTNGVWTSIADTYDASGNGFIDQTHEWIELTPNAMAHATNLSESVIPEPGGVLPANRSLSLGRIWDPSVSAMRDVTAKIFLPDGSEANISDDVSIGGDYFRNKSVDENDYSFWQFYFGSTSANFADGNLDGVVNAADYTVWRNNLGQCVSISCSGESNGAAAGQSANAVPEPAGMFLGLLAGVGCLLCRLGSRRSLS